MKYYPLTLEERQGLVGPAVVGCLAGLFAAYAVLALSAEYELQAGQATSTWAIIGEAAFMFSASLATTVVILGALPIAVRRFRARHNREA